MADEQYRWLDPETAERLLNGESPDTVEPAHRERAARLTHALNSLTPAHPAIADDGELPGEAAALAAFRKVRAERVGAALVGAGSVGDVVEVDEVVRLGVPDAPTGGSRRRRVSRFALAAVLVLGVAGGAAVVAGMGSGSGNAPGSGATVSAAATPTPEESGGGTPSAGVSAEEVVPGGGAAGGTTGTGGGTVTGGGSQGGGATG
ncbi:MAG TPA: hypothetical protein VIU15_26105, partial [Streptomyces sp.]